MFVLSKRISCVILSLFLLFFSSLSVAEEQVAGQGTVQGEPQYLIDAKELARKHQWSEAAVKRLDAIACVSVEIASFVAQESHSSGGTGFLVAPDLVFTTFHLFPGYPELILSKRLQIVVNIRGKMIQGEIPDLRYVGPGPDVALIKLKERVDDIEPIPLVQQDPPKGSTLYMMGCTFSDQPQILEREYRNETWIGAFRLFILNPGPEAGFSGSPLLNAEGKVVGMVRAGTRPFGEFSLAAPWEEIRRLLIRVLPK